MEEALFDWPIVLQYCVKGSIEWFLESSRAWSFSPERSINQPKATRVCIRLINQSNHSIFVRLLFLFSSCVFISRSHENRSLMESLFLIRKSSPFHGRMYVTYMSRCSHRTRYQIQLWRKCSFDDEVKKYLDCKFFFSLSLSLWSQPSNLFRNVSLI